MPISKTCYFCERIRVCGNLNTPANISRVLMEIKENVEEFCDDFTPNADWLYIEQLEKENEELKKELVGWRSSHNWSGKVPEYKTESTTNNDYVVITNTNNEVKP